MPGWVRSAAAAVLRAQGKARMAALLEATAAKSFAEVAEINVRRGITFARVCLRGGGGGCDFFWGLLSY
jgi:hypothetical protein